MWLTSAIVEKLSRVASYVREVKDNWTRFVADVHKDGDSVIITLVNMAFDNSTFNPYYIVAFPHLVLTALTPIICASYASLQRPSSAGPPIHREEEDKAEEKDQNEHKTAATTMTPKTALFWIATATFSLSAQYFILLWFPELLGRFLALITFLGVIGQVGKSATDLFDIVLSLVFPSKWHSKGITYYVEPSICRQFASDDTRNDPPTIAVRKKNPFPGPLSEWNLLGKQTFQLWNLRALFNLRWPLKGRLMEEFDKRYMRLNDFAGYCIGLVLSSLWMYGWRPWQLRNILCVCLCYWTISISPKTSSVDKFSTGLILFLGMVIFDVVMVYYTGMMEVVTLYATKYIPNLINIPLRRSRYKSNIPPSLETGNQRRLREMRSQDTELMLGLGDVMFPAFVIMFCLRLDLYLYYLRKQTVVTDDEIQPQSRNRTSSKIATAATRIIKAPYVELTGNWGEWFWGSPKQNKQLSFPKVYFTAAVCAYIFGILLVTIVGEVFQKSQPALLFICPSVILAVVLTALAREEIDLLWAFGEAEKEEEGSKIPETKDTTSRDVEKSSFYNSAVEEPRSIKRRLSATIRKRGLESQGRRRK